MSTNYTARVVSAHKSFAKIVCPEITAQAMPGNYVHVLQQHQSWRNCYVTNKNENDNTIELYLGANAILPDLADCRVSPLLGNSIEATYMGNPIVVVAEELGLLPGVFLIKELRRQKVKNVSCLVQSNNLLFTPVPSKFVFAEFPPSVIAAVPILEDLGVPSRVANKSGRPGCYEGNVIDLLTLIVGASRVETHWDVYLFGESSFITTINKLLLQYPTAVHSVVLAH